MPYSAAPENQATELNDNLEQLENDVLQLLLKGEEATLETLRSQLHSAERVHREKTGCGFFLHFNVAADAPRLPNRVSLRFGDVSAELEGLRHGAGFVLFIDDGLLTMLEGFTYDEQCPLRFAPTNCHSWEQTREIGNHLQTLRAGLEKRMISKRRPLVAGCFLKK